MSNVVFAFLLTLLAGLFAGVGGIIALFAKRDNTKFLAICLAFSAGVMIYISFAEILDKARVSLIESYGVTNGNIITSIAFFAGIAITALIDKFIPLENESIPDLDITSNDKSSIKNDAKSLKRMGIMSALAITIHNFPEGLLTFIAALQDPALGIAITVAIAMHNIPEGIAVAAPIYYSTGSKKNAVLLSFLSGFAEPLGAVIAYIFLRNYISDVLFGTIFASVAGIMVYISFDQLLPTAQKYADHHIVIKWLFLGMFIMALSLTFLM